MQVAITGKKGKDKAAVNLFLGYSYVQIHDLGELGNTLAHLGQIGIGRFLKVFITGGEYGEETLQWNRQAG